MLKRDTCFLFSTDTCYVIGVRPSDLTDLRLVPIRLECGEVLKPGDGFKEIGTKGYAANPAIYMAEGWTQYYTGLMPHDHSSGPTTLALFKAWSAEGESAFKSREDSERYGAFEWFIAYSWSEANKSFGFWSPAVSLRWINTDRIIRA